jgi:hypothetical protein
MMTASGNDHPSTTDKNIDQDNAMIRFPFFFSKPPSLEQLPLKPYLINLSLDRLVLGVDNIHIDVHVSPQVHNAIKRAVWVSTIKHSRAGNFFEDGSRERHENEKLALKHICTEVLREGIDNAKARSEVQIDFLGQAVLARMFLEEIRNACRKLIANLEIFVRDYELSRDCDQSEWLKMKEKLTEVKYNQRQIVLQVGEELFQVLADVHTQNLKNIRESNFPAGSILPDNFFINPTLHTDNVADDFFLTEKYVLLGQRSDEPDNYASLKAIIDTLLGQTDLGRTNTAGGEEGAKEADVPSADGNALDPWLMEIGNIDLMFNCFDSEEQYRKAKERKESKDILLEVKSRMKIQEGLLNLFYREFKKSRLLKLIAAAYEMKSVYRSYCPPLRPVQVREYLIKPGSRKSIVRELQRRKSFRLDHLSPLQETIRSIKGSSARDREEHLLNFLRDFLRYHRDRENSRLLKQAMDAINLVTDKNTLLLSKKNRLLYEFPLPEERVKEEKPIISHVIIKADIRGSMDVTHTMIARGLNPASYFSLNFFDPISEILGDYGASKVFIEGDAIILSIFENEDAVQGWYSVARACRLAVNMLGIVRQYNVKNRQHDLPPLELGIGICYMQSPPSFLFDGDSRIMISHAINLADRLSGCDKRLRKRFQNQERLFNLSVFQHVRDEDVAATADDLSLRYNVNGIELEPEGFAKLSREISLKRVVYSTENNGAATLYTGKVPTVGGSYQRLVIREAAILKVEPDTLEVIGPTSRKFYEVCTQPAIYEFIDNQS